MERIYELLKKTKFSKKVRRNVNDKPIEFLIFDWVNPKFNNIKISSENKKNQELYNLLTDLIKKTDKNFKYTSIMVNKNVHCKEHIDKDNVGDSCTFCVGDYKGGRLIMGDKKIETKNKIVKFNGQIPHHTEEYQGDRYCIIYYTMASILKYLELNSKDYLEFDNLKLKFRSFTSDLTAFREVIKDDVYFNKNFRLDKSDVWLDCGGNIGCFALKVAKKCKKVISLEVENENYNLIVENIKLNGFENVIAINKSITNDGKGNFLYLRNGDYNKWRHSVEKYFKSDNKISVDSVSFKKIIEDYPEIDCLKMDIEGSEMEILENNDFSRFKKIVFEWHFDRDNKTKRLLNVINKLKKEGFVISGLSLKHLEDKDEWLNFPYGKIIRCVKQ